MVAAPTSRTAYRGQSVEPPKVMAASLKRSNQNILNFLNPQTATAEARKLESKFILNLA
jgi:hypothetical protein